MADQEPNEPNSAHSDILPGGVSYRDPARERRSKELKDRAAQAERTRDDWRRRWMLSLAIGNGAGAIGLTSAFVTTGGALFGLALLAGLWCFTAGLLAAGITPFIEAQTLGIHRRWLGYRADEEEAGERVYYYNDDDEIVWSDDLAESAYSKRERYTRWVNRFQTISAGAFVAGLLVPLTTVTWVLTTQLAANCAASQKGCIHSRQTDEAAGGQARPPSSATANSAP
jgi:hypothetical protein